MNLYEIITNHCGESYVRSYAWAKDEQHATELFKATADPKYSIQRVVKLLSSDDAPFCTEPSDSGWQEVESGAR